MLTSEGKTRSLRTSFTITHVITEKPLTEFQIHNLSIDLVGQMATQKYVILVLVFVSQKIRSQEMRGNP